jgi:hypothetical protein
MREQTDAHALDAPIPLLFHIVHRWRRASEAQPSAEYERRRICDLD